MTSKGNPSAYLVMDFINDLVHRDGPNGATLGAEAERRGVFANTAKAVRSARSAGILIIFVRVGFDPRAGGRDISLVSPLFRNFAGTSLLQLGAWGTEIHSAIDVQAGDLNVVKQRISPFYATALEAVLRANGIKRLYLSGVSTNLVVNSAVREAHDRDYEVHVIEDCCSASSETEHTNAIEGFRYLCHSIIDAGAIPVAEQA
jgi:nicotinamidase-related amidase